MKDDKTTPSHDLTPRADGDVTDSGSPLHSKRRTLLKKTGTVTATAALATWLLPKQWQKPVIDVVGLPLHAQTSPAVATTVATTRATTTEATSGPRPPRPWSPGDPGHHDPGHSRPRRPRPARRPRPWPLTTPGH